VLTPPTVSTWNQTFKGGSIPVGTATVRVSLFGTAFFGSPDGYMDNVDVQVTNEVLQPFLEITVDRDTGGITLSNRTGSPVNLKSYSITSAFEGLEPANWLSIAENYDKENAGPNQVDAAHSWSELTNPTAHSDLSEADLESGLGASLGHTRTINLGNSGPWIRTATEDLVFQYISGSQVVTGIVAYTGNDDVPFDVGDLNTDGTINSADWVILRNNQHTDLSLLSLAEAYRVGDLTGDKQNGHADFAAFKSIYETANGSGSFAAMIADLGRVPEPSSVLLILTGGLLMLPLRIRVES
jgi:hypothetical protein